MIPGITAGGRKSAWTSLSLPVTGNPVTLIASDTLMQYVTGTGSAYTVYESDDGGVTWPRSYPVSMPNSVYGIVKTTGNTFVWGTSGVRGRYRTDGVGNSFTNSSPEPISNNLPNGVLFEPTNNVMLLACGTGVGNLYTSANQGVTWTARITSQGTAFFHSPVYVDGRYYMVTSGGQMLTTTTADASTGWTTVTIDAAASLRYALGINSTFYCWTIDGKLYSGPVGATAPTQVSTTSPLRQAALYNSGKVFSWVNNTIYVGTDPTDVAALPDPAPTAINSIAVANGYIYALEAPIAATRIYRRPIPT